MESDLSVIVDGRAVGRLVREDGEYIFTYDTGGNVMDKKAYISLTMPVRTKGYLHGRLFPIFEMHLPEGYLLSIIKKHFSKITKTDDFGLLLLMSENIKGRLSYKNTTTPRKQDLTLDHLLHPKSTTLFDELVKKFALTSALSGVQPKVLARVQDKATLSLQDYIVKSWGDDYPQLAINEFYCMSVLKKANVDVPEFYLSDDNQLFIMKRFDVTQNGHYLGFEDMCVLQAKQRDDKYEGSYEQVANTIRIFVSPKYKKESLQQYFKMIIVNYFVKNGDAHLKNFGLIYENFDEIKLAPAYDVVSTAVYIKNDIPALSLLGSKNWWRKKHLIRFGIEYCDLSAKEANDLYGSCVVAMKAVACEITQRLTLEKNREVKRVLSALLEVAFPDAAIVIGESPSPGDRSGE